MNKGFAYYFKQAFKISAQTIWKNKNVLKSMLYFFMSLVARITLIFGAMVDLGDVRQAKFAIESRTVDVPQSLTKASQKPMWTKIVATAIEILMYLGGFLLVSVICGAIFALGLVIGQFVANKYLLLVYIIFAVPCLLIYLVYTIIVVAVFSPTSYVIDSNPGLSAGEVVSVCVNSMKSRGKMTVILCVFVPALIMLLIMGLCAVGFVLIPLYLGGRKYTLLLLLVLAIASVLLLGFTIPVFNMTKNVSLVMLFGDIALDPVNAQKRTAGINIKKISGARVDREEVADNLNALFDGGIEEKVPAPEELERKHKAKKKPKKFEEPREIKPVTATAATAANIVPPESGEGFDEEDDYPEEAPEAEKSVDKVDESAADNAGGQTDGANE